MTYVGSWKYFKAILIEVAQPCNEMLLYCSFGSQIENCSMIFNTVLTDDGLCCTFNALDTKFLLRNFSYMNLPGPHCCFGTCHRVDLKETKTPLNIHFEPANFRKYKIIIYSSEENLLMPAMENHYQAIDWTPEKGYPTDIPSHYYPRVSGGTGVRMGLTVVLNVSSEEYYCSKSNCIGFKVLVHNPAELPKISNYGFLMTAGREARIPIEPIYQDASPSIRSITKTVRKCLFSDEGDLLYYRTYSRKNCELECEAQIVMERCLCILYYLPRFNPDVPICGPNNNLCTNQVQSEIESSNRSVSCDSCLPACFELNYQTTLTASTMTAGNFKTSDDFPPQVFNGKNNISDLAIMHFYYTSNIFRSTKKSEIFGFTEFLSNTGGLLGLFLGFSIFSVIEIIYYITVRPYCAARPVNQLRKRKQYEDRLLAKKSSKIDSSYIKLRENYWLRKSQKHTKNTLRNVFVIPESLQNEKQQIYPYLK